MKTRALVSLLLVACACAPNTWAAPGRLADVFNGDMLGAHLRRFEALAGAAQAHHGESRTYRVQGCEIVANVAGGSVNELRLTLSPTCRADLHSFIGKYAPPANRPLTFGALDAAGGGGLAFYADCLQLCGNVGDPSVYGLWEGPRAVGFVQVLVQAQLVEDAPTRAAHKWRAAMTRSKGSDYVIDARFNCERTFDAQAMQAFANVRVSAVTIGTDLNTPDC